MLDLDGTETKSKLGANAILAVSLANAKAAAEALGMPLFKYLGGPNAKVLPVPMANVINGGAHSDAPIDFQEFMIMPHGLPTFSEGLARDHRDLPRAQVGPQEARPEHRGRRRRRLRAEARRASKTPSNRSCRPSRTRATKPASKSSSRSMSPRREFYNGNGTYTFKKSTGKTITGDELVDFYVKLCGKYPIVSIEDGCAESDWKSWKTLTDKLGSKVQLVGDDLFVTNVKFLKKGIDTGTANSILVKVNQIGSLTETLDAVELAQTNGYTAVLSHRSGETEDATIADIAVATNCGQIKTGSLSRSDRLAKYNQLLRIEQLLGKNAVYAGETALHK